MSKPVNLIADKLEIREQRKKQSIRVFFCMLAVMCVGICVLLSLKSATVKSTEKLQELQAQIKEFQPQSASAKKMHEDFESASDIAEWASHIRKNNEICRRALLHLGALTPGEVFINEVTLSAIGDSKTLKFSGIAMSLDDVSAIIKNLSTRPEYEITLESTRSGEIAGRRIVNFQCSISMKSDSDNRSPQPLTEAADPEGIDYGI